jgi:transposase
MAKRKTRRRLSDEFKSEAVKLVKNSNRSTDDLAMEIGINAKSISEWAKRAEESGQAIEEDERSELRRLRKENSELRMEREIPNRATAFFAKENR